ncbi:hypothetical protein FACS189413_03030 [Bacteroidia bacterium]|nr:hypothetical protein FACS189413_03030 [Bacteroidia bacterium]
MKQKITILFCALAMVFSLQAAEITVTSSEDSGDGTLRQAILDAEPGSVITISTEVTDIVLDDEIVITKTLTIDGQGATISVENPGASTYRLFNVGNYAESGNTECDVILQNLILKGGNVSGRTDNGGKGANGGIIHVETADNGAINFTVKNCTFSDGKGNNGGAFSINNVKSVKSVTIENSVFTANYAASNNGAALLRATAISIKDCVFEGNSSKGNSVIAIDQASTSVSITGSVFEDNLSVENQGRGISTIQLNRINGPVTIANCSFSGNKNTLAAESGDGASVISNQSATANIIIRNSTFYDNLGFRGTVYIHTGSAKFVNNTFAGNRSVGASYGGAVYVTSAAEANVTFVNNIFAYNYAGNNKVDIYLGGNAVRSGDHNIIGGYAGGSSALNTLTNTHLFAYGSDPVDDEDLFADYTTNTAVKKIPVLDAEKGAILLSATSIARNAGTSAYAGVEIPATDQLGATRGAIPSLGAVEYITPTALNPVQTVSSFAFVNASRELQLTAPANRLDLIQLNGQTVFSKIQPANTVSLTGVSSGLYIVRLETALGTQYQKLIVK